MRTVLLILLFAIGGHAHADMSNRVIYHACTSDERETDSFFCAGYISAVQNQYFDFYVGFMMGRNYHNPTNKQYKDIEQHTYNLYGCVSQQSQNSILAAYLAWVDDHPEKLDENASRGFKDAMADAFPPPCE